MKNYSKYSDDLNVDEDPPPAPVAVVDEGLEKELERLEENETEELQETPEDGIIDDEEEVTSEVAHEKEETKSVAAEEVLASGWKSNTHFKKSWGRGGLAFIIDHFWSIK